MLFTHIRHFLPEILKETVYRIKECDERLRDLGPSAPIDPRHKTQMLWSLITDFNEVYKNSIRGKFDKGRIAKVTKDLAGGATIRYYFNQLLKEYTGDYRATHDYSDRDIIEAMSRHEGDSMPGFPSVDVFIFLLQPLLETIREPIVDCVSDVHSYLEQLGLKIIERIFYRFPDLGKEISGVVSKVLLRERDFCLELVESMIDSEEGYIFTNDDQYLKNRTDLIPKATGPGRDADMAFIDEIRSRIDSYFRVVIKNIRDAVPKVIGYFLVRGSMNKLNFDLYEYVNSNENVLQLVSEPSHISSEREVLQGQLETLRKAERILKHDPQLAAQADNLEQEIRKQEEDLKKEAENKKKREEEKKQKEEDMKRRKEEAKANAQTGDQRPPANEEAKRPAPVKPPGPATASLFGDESK